MLWIFVTAAVAYILYRFLKFVYADQSPQLETRNTQSTSVALPPIMVPPTKTFSPRDQIAGIVESVDWVNDITSICWPYICKIIESQLSPTLEPLVNLYLPKPFSSFRITGANLGKDPVKVDKVIVHRRFHDSISMDLDVDFRGSPNVTMKCNPLNASFGIKELRWSGRLSILLRPLVTQLPLIGAVQVAMVTHPEIGLDFTGVANIADFGPIEKIVRMVLKNVIASMLVLPNRFLYKLSESVDFFDVYQPPVGVMAVTIERGRYFTKEKKLGMIKTVPDLYCRASFGLDCMKTEVQMNNLDPEWRKLKSFVICDLEQPFQLDCYDKDTLSKDDLVGSLSVSAETLLRNESKWYKFTDNIDDKVAENGEILLGAQLLGFRDPTERVRGKCLVTVLIDRATNLPEKTHAAAVRVTIGSEKRKVECETPQILKPDSPIPGINPANPIWNFSFDRLVDDFNGADVKLEVFDGKHVLGGVVVDAKELEMSNTNVHGGEFSIGEWGKATSANNYARSNSNPTAKKGNQ